MADFANMKTWPDRLAHTSLRNFTAENDHFWLEQSPANKTKWAQVRAQSVLVQREMECGRSPLASIARASTGRAGRSKATPTGMRKQRAETATGFKKKIHIGWSALTQPAWVEETNWLGKKMVTARTLILTARRLPWGNLPRWRFFVNDTVFGSESAHFSPTATLRPSGSLLVCRKSSRLITTSNHDRLLRCDASIAIRSDRFLRDGVDQVP